MSTRQAIAGVILIVLAVVFGSFPTATPTERRKETRLPSARQRNIGAEQTPLDTPTVSEALQEHLLDPLDFVRRITNIKEMPLLKPVRDAIEKSLARNDIKGILTQEDIAIGGLEVLEKLNSGDYAVLAPQNLPAFEEQVSSGALAAFYAGEQIDIHFRADYLGGDILSAEKITGPTFQSDCGLGAYVLVPESWDIPPVTEDDFFQKGESYESCDPVNRCCFVVSVAVERGIVPIQDVYQSAPGFCESTCSVAPACKTLCEAVGGPGTAWLLSNEFGICACGQPRYTATCEPNRALGRCVLVPGGSGQSECSSDADCRTFFNTCTEDNRCVTLAGAGIDQCTTNADCVTSRLTCRGEQCVRIPGAGEDACTSDDDCPLENFRTCIFEGLGGFCAVVSGKSADGGQDYCTTDAHCLGYVTDFESPDPFLDPPVIGPGQTLPSTCQDYTGDGIFDACIEGGNSGLLCNNKEDCIREEHTQCAGNQCTVVKGPGINACGASDEPDSSLCGLQGLATRVLDYVNQGYIFPAPESRSVADLCGPSSFVYERQLPFAELQDLAATGRMVVLDTSGTCNWHYEPVDATRQAQIQQLLQGIIDAAAAGHQFRISSFGGATLHRSDSDHYKGRAMDISPADAHIRHCTTFIMTKCWPGWTAMGNFWKSRVFVYDEATGCTKNWHLHLQTRDSPGYSRLCG